MGFVQRTITEEVLIISDQTQPEVLVKNPDQGLSLV